MTTENLCPFCGAPLDNVTGSQCPSCGVALPKHGNSDQTMISQKPVYANSAEVMDEVKRLVSEGDAGAASEVAGAEFGLNDELANSVVEQVEVDMKHSGYETPAAKVIEPTPVDYGSASDPTRVIDAPNFSEPPKPPKSRQWIVWASIGAVVFLCLCCCLPLAFSMVRVWQSN